MCHTNGYNTIAHLPWAIVGHVSTKCKQNLAIKAIYERVCYFYCLPIVNKKQKITLNYKDLP